MPALSKVFFLDDQGKSPAGTLGLFPCGLGAVALAYFHEEMSDGVLGLIVVVSFIAGLVGGLFVHRVPRYRWHGAFVGGFVALGILVATYTYILWRFELNGSVMTGEVLLPMLLGAAPASFVYYLLMRNEGVSAADAAKYASSAP